MSELNQTNIGHLADLARLSLSADEQAKFSQELPKIVEFVEQLQQVRLDGDDVSVKATPLEVMRDDVVSSERLTPAQLEQLAPTWRAIPPAGGQVEVPAVFGEDADA